MSRAFLISLATVLIFGTAFNSCVASLPPEPVELVADLSAPRIRIPEDFLGLSFETCELRPDANGKLQFAPDNQPLRTLLQTMGVKNLRFGGNAADAPNVLDPAMPGIDAMFQLAQAIPARVIYSVRFSREGRLNGFVTADEAAAAATCRHILENYPDSLAAFAIGNEPDMYFKRLKDQYQTGDVSLDKPAKDRRAYEQYRAAWKQFAAVITATNPAALFIGPGTTGNPVWAKWFGQDFVGDDRIAFIENHWYPGGNGKQGEPGPKLQAALSPDWHKLYAAYLADNGFPEPGRRPFRITESNSYYNGGAPDMSDTMASALWALDYGHWFAAHGCAGINFHTCTHVKYMVDVEMTFNYASFVASPGGYTLRPIGYGLTLLGMGCQGDSIPLNVISGDCNVSAYAVAGHDGNLYLTLINKEYDAGARPTLVRFNLKGGHFKGSGESLALVAPDSNVRAQSGVTLNGMPVGENGSWTGKWTVVTANHFGTDGVFSIVVPPASALLLRLTLM